MAIKLFLLCFLSAHVYPQKGNLPAKQGYGYNITMYSAGDSTLSITTSSYLLYGDDLVEFVIKPQYSTKINMLTEERRETVTSDTIGCRLILADKRRFVHLDSFRRDFTILIQGPLHDMRGGMALGGYEQHLWHPIAAPLRDTMIKNVHYKICDSVYAYATEAEMITRPISFLFLERNLNSIFSLYGYRHIVPGLSFAGTLGRKIGVHEISYMLIENIRELPASENALLHYMFEKARKQVGE